MDSINIKLEGIEGRRKRKKYVKEYQDFLEERFEPELRRLTRSEGQILSKLIYRRRALVYMRSSRPIEMGFRPDSGHSPLGGTILT